MSLSSNKESYKKETTAVTTSDLIQLAMLLMIIIQLGWTAYTFSKSQRLQLIEMKADHDRRKKEATISHVNDIRGVYRPLRLALDQKFGDGNVINLDQIDESSNNDLKEILSLMEHLAAGVNTGVFDFEMIFIMSGTYFKEIFERSMPFINERRRVGSDESYIEFEHMVDRIKKRKSVGRSRAADLKELPV